MTDRPRVAVLIACHNDGETIVETINSLANEPGTEIVVVDDGSTDAGTLEVLAALERGRLRVLRQENSGPSSAWRAGFTATSSPYVMPFSSDDLLVPDAIRLLAEALDRNPRAGAAWGDLESFGAASAYVPSAPVLCPWLVTYVNALPGIALFRRESLASVGGWRLTTGIEDWDLWMRLAAGGFPGVHVPVTTFRYRRDAGGRFQRRVQRFEPFYEELRSRNPELFDQRHRNRRVSVAPLSLKVLLPIVDRLPFVSRLKKVQLCDLLSLLLWRAGVSTTVRIVAQGVLFRVRRVTVRQTGATARD